MDGIVVGFSWCTDLGLRLTTFVASGRPPLEDLAPGILRREIVEVTATDDVPFPSLDAHRAALQGHASTHERPWRGRLFQCHLGPARDDRGQITGCVGFALDVSDQRLAQQSLHDSEARYQAISELTSTYAYSAILEPGGNLFPEWVTGDFVQITGYTLDEIKRLGGPIKLVHSADRPVAVRRTERLLSGEPSICEFRIITKSGATRWLRDYGRPVRDDTRRRTIRIFGAAQDITDRKQAEQALCESEERFRLAFEEGPLGMVTVTADGTLLQANRALGQMLGYLPEELPGRRIADIIHPDDVATSTSILAQVASGQIVRHTWEKRYLTKDGQIAWGRTTATVLRDHEGSMMCVLGMIEDITDRKHTEQTLRRAERLASIGTLAAGIAHELNNPLGAITLSVDAVTMSEDQPGREEILKVALENIRASALRCGRIVRSVLQFARGEVAQRAPGDLAEVVRRARDMTRSFAAKHDVSLHLDVAEDLPEVIMNATEMGQVFVNLLSNAIQASRAGDRVSVRLTSTSDSVRVSVEDQGRGMSDDEIDRIFDPFYTSRAEQGGTGLGLSITYGIIQRHGGSIDVVSHPGSGTTMMITLPAAPSPPSP